MSIFNTISDALNELSDSAETTFKRVTSQSQLKRVVYAAALIAWADGDCDADEKAKTMSVIKAKLPQFGARDVAKHFGAASDLMDLGAEFGIPDILATIRSCSSDDEAALIVRTAILIGGADGDFDDNEKAMVRKICDVLNVNQADYGL